MSNVVWHAALLFADAGAVAIVGLVSPYRADRERVRAAHAERGLDFIEVFVDAPLDICEKRDPKGQYARARRGDIAHFTGVDDPYEQPLEPDLTVHTDQVSVEDAIARVLAALSLT